MDLSGQIIDKRYKVLEKLGQGGMSVVFRARDVEENREVALKVLRDKVTSRRIEDIIRFRREATTVSKLKHPHIVRVYGVGEHAQEEKDKKKPSSINYLVMELAEGKSLADLLDAQTKFSLEETIEIIKQVAGVLEYVHNIGILHRDLKPGNIMIVRRRKDRTSPSRSTPTLQANVLDFGLAQMMEYVEIKEEREIVGTFSYMSPEQSGIIKKPVDERSDLYSLGIIFYELLTGEKPFKGKSVSVLLHQQMAQLATPPSKLNPEVTKVITEIALKLLRKDAKERYQTAKGLIFDLEKYQGGNTSFVIGKEDKLRRLTYRTRLIGRDEEMTKLQTLFGEARVGQGKLCLIAGEAGRGKSRLVEEMREYIYQGSGTFIGGKCFAQENKIPYGPFKDALNEYIDELQRLKPKEKEEIIKGMHSSLGELGEIILKLNPNMRDILGKVPALVPLDPERENKRFLMVSSKFFCNLGQKDKPFVLFLDDLQWADEGSLSLLLEIISEIKDFPLLILGTYRDNEVGEGHSLYKLKQEAQERGYPLEEVPLELFDEHRLNKLISELLLEDEERTKELSKYILDKSKGNPFFAIEIARQLVSEGAITYHEGKKHWQIDWERIRQIAVSPNIIDIVLKRIEALEEENLNLLSYAAVIGREFEMNLLFSLTDLAQEKVISIVDEAISFQLLEISLERGKLLFVHDRIKDAFYQRIGKEKKKERHFKVAQAIEALHKDDKEEVLFDLAHHYTAAGDKDKSLEYALPAAKKAKEGYANEEAIRYYNIAITLLEEKQQKQSPPWIEAKEGLTTVYLTTGRNDEAIKIAREVLPLKKTPIEKATIYRQIGMAYFKKGDWKNCEDNIAEGFALLGEKIPTTPLQVKISFIKELIIHILHCLFPRLFSHKEGRPVKPEYSEILWGYVFLSWTYILSDVKKFTWSILRGLNLAESNMSKSKELAAHIGGYATLCMALALFKRGIQYHEKALKMKKELQDEWGVAQCLQWMGYCYSWQGNYQKSIEYSQESTDKFRKMGDMWEWAMTLNALGCEYFYKGDYPRGIDAFSQYLDMSQKTQNDYGITAAESNLVWIYAETGDFDKGEKHGKKALVLSKKKRIWFSLCFTNIYLGYLASAKREWQRAIRHLEEAKKIYEENTFLKDYTIYVYPYLAEAYLENIKAQASLENKPLKQIRIKKQELKKIKLAAKEALKQTRAWPNHYGGSLRVMAKYYWLAGRKIRAKKFFLKGIEQTKALGRKYELAKTYYEYGNFLASLNKMLEARDNYLKAYNIFKEIGAKAYIKRCQDVLNLKEEEVITEEKKQQEKLKENRAMASVLDTSRYLSSILDLDELLEKIMDCTIELVGAESGLLMLYPEEEKKQKKLEVKIVRNVKQEEAERTFSASHKIISKVEADKKPLIIEDAGAEKELKGEASVVKYGLKSVLCAPIMVRGNMLGTIYLSNHLVSGLFSKDDLEVLELLSSQAGVSIENARLYKRAVTDGLTQLYNRNFFENYLIKSVNEVHRYHKKLSLLMIDIDHFKRFNDRYGHPLGDSALRSVAKIIQGEVRGSDLAARYGGEEFVMVFPETDKKEAKQGAERVRKAIEDNKIAHKQNDKIKQLSLTVSIGVAEYRQDEDRLQLIERADKALYKAKKLGRNRVVMAEQ